MPVYPAQLPPYLRKDQKRETELVLYDLFQSNIPGEQAVIYNAEWLCSFRSTGNGNIYDPLTGETPRPGTYPIGETDFIHLAPAGLLVLEVKGGIVTVENGTWQRRDKEGISHLMECPLAQARRNMFALLKTIKSSRRFYHKFVMAGYAVVLPHTLSWEQDFGGILPRQLFIFKEHIDDRIFKKLKSVLDFWAQLWKSPELLSATDIKEIISAFAPTVQLKKPRLIRTIEEFQTEVLELTEKQFFILKGLSQNKKALITGGAGTGKTLLAMEKARQTALQGHRTLFTCANRLLARHVKNQLAGIDNLDVMNFHELCYNWGKEAGILNLTDPDGPDRYRLSQEYYDDILPAALVEAAALLTRRYDAIIVDEAQDMRDLFWTALQFCFENDEGGIFYIFYDPDQAIWYQKEALPFEGPVFQLTTNLRNSVDVFKCIKKLSTETAYESGCVHRGQFKTFLLNNEIDTVAVKLQPILSELIVKNKVPPKDITILTGRSRNKSQLAKLEQIGHFPLTRELNDIHDKTLFSSIRQFRGMESAVVILVELDYLVDPDKLRQELAGRSKLLDDENLLNIARETTLIGVSRAQHTLYILSDARTFDRLNELGLAVYE